MFGLENRHILFIKNALKKTLNKNAKFIYSPQEQETAAADILMLILQLILLILIIIQG